jgi:hypothetical protein
VIEVNRKILVVFIALLAAAMLATPLVGATQACGFRRIIQPYAAEYIVKQIKAPNPPVVKGDFSIVTGSVSEGAYNGPLGTGTMTAELIRQVTNTVTQEGCQTAKNTLVITSGPYGAGTLVGYSWFTFDDIVPPPPPTPTRGATFLSGELGSTDITIIAEKGFVIVLPPAPNAGSNVWEKGWMIIS